MHSLWWLASFSQHNVLSAHPCCTWIRTSLFLGMNNIPLCGCTMSCLFILQLVDILGYFYSHFPFFTWLLSPFSLTSGFSVWHSSPFVLICVFVCLFVCFLSPVLGCQLCKVRHAICFCSPYLVPASHVLNNCWMNDSVYLIQFSFYLLLRQKNYIPNLWEILCLAFYLALRKERGS